ncbi:MAG: hypothetical protein Sapg2KO_24700 [Saprospiraceae bacterium]
MRKFIYIAIILAFLAVGFTNLESNEWRPTELPVRSNIEKVLPEEEWNNILIGEWDFITVFPTSEIYKGKVIYNRDSTFVRKVSYSKKTESGKLKAGGTVRGTWQVNTAQDEGFSNWHESSSNCNIQPVSYALCNGFKNVLYGNVSSDIKDYEVLYFNHDRIEIICTSLATDEIITYRFTRAR